ncbi:hypothetical protein Bca101_081163 [Brassica carinata]
MFIYFLGSGHGYITIAISFVDFSVHDSVDFAASANVPNVTETSSPSTKAAKHVKADYIHTSLSVIAEMDPLFQVLWVTKLSLFHPSSKTPVTADTFIFGEVTLPPLMDDDKNDFSETLEDVDQVYA